MKSFRHGFRVPFHELDPGGVLFHAHLFVHAHEAYELFMQEIGFGLAALLRAEELAIPLVQVQADYRHPLRLDDRVMVVIQALELGRSSFTLGYDFQRDRESCASARTTHVVVDRRSGRAVPLPAGLVSGLEAYLRRAS